MSILTTNSPKAKEIWFKEDKIYFLLADGRELGVPIEWFPKLRDANPDQLKNWRLIGSGDGVHWEELDEDISIEGLLVTI
ncbi:Protein of unknown function [Reichenbachiella faecimaris]|uniref:DUF2442 domain-containing protein n=1 Tax=Reichenbachiella faecimaris TaxID=692418 RepID=A0A1W2GQ70_REIFA|nr:DUF2442 domain-containing protein [Reichenbachiella faecimaris]SMD38830.1 Protein of unknown function [Reichenbachiella faecimaris]